MDMTAVLAKVMGAFLVVLGAAILFRRRYYVAVFAGFAEARLTRAIAALAELAAGLLLVAAHNVWSPLPAAIITLAGWLLVLEACLFLLLPDEPLSRLIAAFNTPSGYVVLGLLYIAVGCYLAGFGFGLI